ncbi:hypothetical protein BOTNAR_0018g00360 [Botryotinia narcissicola]|uniref:Uncharacterized protein n=1 Tax=Botryotinia narcissicola TaxID=278944 RepID=A0A4Z1JI57_9HELO|nr:hypothetical protein BOTNAR_0018g00360 [Botryotinia narcissicola]
MSNSIIMNQGSATPELSSGERNIYSPATAPPSLINTQKQKAALWAQPSEPKSPDSKSPEADTDTAEQSCNPEVPEAPADTDIVEPSCSPEKSYKKLYAEMYKKAYIEAYQKACWDSFNQSYIAGFNAKFIDHYMKAYIRNKKQDALMKLDLDKIAFLNEESTQTSTQMIQLFDRMQDLEKNRKRDKARRGITQLFGGLLAMLFIYLFMDMTIRRM